MKLPTSFVVVSAVGASYGAALLLKDYLGGERYKAEHEILGKTVIITGANTGIGKETAKQLAKRGGRLLLACRDLKKCEIARNEIIDESFNKNVVCKELDLASCESIRKFVKTVKDEEKRIDVLINNAGVMSCPKQHTSELFEWQFGVNYLGPFLLTNLLLDKLKQSQHARIINLISPVYKRTEMNFEDLNSINFYDPKEAYAQSKLAVMLFSQELARRLEGSNVTVNCANPGVSKTEIGRHLPMGQSKVSGGMLSPIMWLAMKTPVQGAQTSIFLAVDPGLEKVSGKLFTNSKEDSIAKCALDKDAAKRLWLISEKWTRLSS
ncbi:retinol dehydrogenase 13-like [Mercenaria mercenaria]|uniref:retinol dehydrogenase 13-like n=1 Tax=Mercenaria mercenaria TaxID=6596 RepID=UPI00234EB1AC|nr:retinol dehydrogenase 13-like [Mercenaria mercenaria]